MKQITTIPDYCKEINISPPKHLFFDIRSFEDNMKTVNAKQAPFRHEFYAIALRHEGSNKEVSGKPLNESLFFNSPYQIITWDILLDWKGWYIIFDHKFISMNPAWNNFIINYPFFRVDKYIAFDLPKGIRSVANTYFQKIFAEYHSSNRDKFLLIQAYTQLLLLLTKRFFEKLNIHETAEVNNRTADILLVSRFQTMIETLSQKEESNAKVRHPSFYAEQLNIHPNHLNAVVKQITVEHPYGTIKRQWGFYYIITKRRLKRASADVGFMFVAYNLRRLISIVDKNRLTKFLKELVALFFPKTGVLKRIRTVLCLQTIVVVNRSWFIATLKTAAI